MDQTTPNGARRNEDIALDLLKFVATTAQVTKPAAGAAGFVSTGTKAAEDQVSQLLDLYRRCLSAVAGR